MGLSDKAFLGRGWAFPFSIEPDRGRIALAAYEEDIKQSIRIILSTGKGERVMRPDFGCGIHELVFGAISTALLSQIERDVKEALRRFEARIEVEHVTVDSGFLAEGRLEIDIHYRVRTTNQRDNYVYPFYFKEAT
jgi:phage baseplate assembly protein W